MKMGVNQNNFFFIPILLGLCATQALEMNTMTSDTFKEVFSDNAYSENLLNVFPNKYSRTRVQRVLTSWRGRYKRESVSRSRRQGLGLLPTEEENGESVKKLSSNLHCLGFWENYSLLSINWVFICLSLPLVVFNSEFNKRSCHIPISSAWSEVDMKWTFSNILSTLLFKSVYILNVSACLILNKVISNPPLRIFEF